MSTTQTLVLEPSLKLHVPSISTASLTVEPESVPPVPRAQACSAFQNRLWYHEDPGTIDISFGETSDAPICRNVSLKMLRLNCGIPWLERHIINQSLKSEYLELSASECEPLGVRIVVAWMEVAWKCRSLHVVPHKLDLDLFTLCCTERAMHAFGRHDDGEVIRTYLEQKGFRQKGMTVEIIRPVWDLLPKGSWWSDMAVDAVQRGVLFMQEVLDATGFCYCGLSTHHQPDCLAEWVARDDALREALGPFRNSRGTHMHTSFGPCCTTSTAERVRKWTMDVEDRHPYPFGSFPSDNVLLGGLLPKIRTLKRLGPIYGHYQLSLSRHHGGSYIETFSNGARTRTNLNKQRTTEVSRDWLTSRGCRGGGSSAEPEAKTRRHHDRAQSFIHPDIHVSEHNCPDWLADDDHWVCAFREGPLHVPESRRIGPLQTYIRYPILFSEVAAT